MKNASNNGYTRCRECSTVYESNLQSCPNCGTLNIKDSVKETYNCTEEFEPVFNVID